MRFFKIFSLMICLSHGLVSPASIRFPVFRNHVRAFSKSVVAEPSDEVASPPSYLKWGSPNKYKFGRQIGAGKFSHVVNGHCRQSGRPVAIKVLKPCPSWKIKREVRILETLKGGPHIVELIDKVCGNGSQWETVGNGTSSLKHEDGVCYGLVFAHCGPVISPSASSSSSSSSSVPSPQRLETSSTAVLDSDSNMKQKKWFPFSRHSSPRRLSHRGLTKLYSDLEIRWAMYQLFESLEFAHKNKIIHRDLKPANVLVTGRGVPGLEITVADWGLADFDYTGARHAVKVASRPFKAPELLLGDPHYTCSADLWSAGCVFAGLLFNKDPFIKGKDNTEQISQLAQVLGSDGFYEYAHKYLSDVEIKKGLKVDPVSLQRKNATDRNGFKSERKNLSFETLKAIGSHPKLSWVEYAQKILEEDKEVVDSCPNDIDSKLLESKLKFATTDALDLLNRLLCFDRNERISAKDAKQHPYFDLIRQNKDLLS